MINHLIAQRTRKMEIEHGRHKKKRGKGLKGVEAAHPHHKL